MIQPLPTQTASNRFLPHSSLSLRTFFSPSTNAFFVQISNFQIIFILKKQLNSFPILFTLLNNIYLLIFFNLELILNLIEMNSVACNMLPFVCNCSLPQMWFDCLCAKLSFIVVRLHLSSEQSLTVLGVGRLSLSLSSSSLLSPLGFRESLNVCRYFESAHVRRLYSALLFARIS